MFKRLLKTDAVRALACSLITAYIRFTHATGRWRHVDDAHVRPFWDADEPFILAFWHGRLLMSPYCWPLRKKPLKVLISQHRDGDLIARSIAPFGLETIRGSSNKPGRRSKGGAAALRAMVQQLKDGGSIAITPDGPKGPAEKAQDGIVQLARMTGAPVIPIGVSARGPRLQTWDRFLLAAPFSRGYYVWGAPIRVEHQLDGDGMDDARRRIEQALRAVTRRADELAGRDVTEVEQSERPARKPS